MTPSCNFIVSANLIIISMRFWIILIAVEVKESSSSESAINFSRTFDWIGKLQCSLNIFHSNSIPRLDFVEIIEQFHGSHVPFSLVDRTEIWGIEQWYFGSYLPRRIQSSTRCLTFLLMDPSPQDVLKALEHSGFFVNKQALFIGYLTSDTFNSIQRDGSLAWPRKIFVSDVSLIFLVADKTLIYIFCYFCLDKLVPTTTPLEKEGDSGRSLIKAIDSINNDAKGNPIYTEQESWWAYRMEDSQRHCRPFDNRVARFHYGDALICFPQAHFILYTIITKYNATYRPSPEIELAKLWSPVSSFSSEHPMIILPGPFARVMGQLRNYTKEVILNRTTDKLIYCVDKRKVTGGILSMLATLVDPFQKSVWICLIFITILIIVIVRPENPIALAAVLVSQGYLPNFQDEEYNRKTRIGLVIFWSILMSTSVSYLYDASLTADMLVPLPDHVIATFEEMILTGYKIGYMNTRPIEDAWKWYAKKFNKSSILNMNNISFVSINFDATMGFQAIDRAGELAIFKSEGELDETLEIIKTKLQLNASVYASIVCHVVKEPIIDELFDVSLILFHLSSEFVKTIQRILESGILKVFTQMRKWQKTYLVSLARNQKVPEERGFKATGFSVGSKIPVIFLMWSCGLGVSFLMITFEILQSTCMKLCHPQRRVRKFRN